MARVQLITAAYTARSKKASAQRCVNLFPEINPPDAPSQTTFYGTPGYTLWSTIPGSGPVRGAYVSSNGILFAVRGATLYRYNGGSWVESGTLGSTAGRVVATDNGTNAVFVDGSTTAPTVNLTDFTQGAMSGDGWYGADFCYFLNGRIVFNKPDTQQFYWTGLYELTLDPLDFASAEGSPDAIVSMLVDHAELWFWGPQSLEIFYDSGDQDQPYQRVQGAFNEVGCVAPHSINRLDNTIYWLGRDRNGGNIVFRASNYQPQRVSTHAIEQEFDTYSRTDDAFSWTYQQEGHTFYVLVFPTASKTWVFDVATGLWHERAYRQDDGSLIRHRGNCHAYFDAKHLIGDFENGNIYQLSMNVYQDNGDEIVRFKDSPHNSQGVRMFYSRLRIDCQVGVGDEAGSEPNVWIQWSDDGGVSWSSSVIRSLGKLGESRKQVNVTRLGSGQDRIFRLGTSANAPIAFNGAFVNAVPGVGN
jgi:hypothetical protein